MRSVFLFAALGLAACNPAADLAQIARKEAPPAAPLSPRPAHRPPPTGATLGPEGFATILDAPPNAAVVAAARTPVVNKSDGRGWYAREHNISEVEARRRLAEQERLRPVFTRLMQRLRREQAGNYVGAMLRHDPDWSYVFFFKRDASATLAKYTREPRFLAESAVYSQKDRERLIAPWNARWQAEGIPFGYGLDAVYPTMDVDLGIGEADYRAMTAAKGWGEPPAPIVLKFAKEPVAPAVDRKAAPFLRGFASEQFATLMQLEALGTGKLILEDGCLRVLTGDGKKSTAIFHRETGIGFDEAGYLALIDRMTGKVRARIGERLAWGGPNGTEKGIVGLDALKAACPGEIVNIGNPDSAAAFEARYPHTRINTPPPPAVSPTNGG